MSYAKDPRVDAYIDPLPTWQQQICHRVRDLVHAADPAVEETIKRTVAFREGEPINEPALTAVFRQIVADNQAGGWRKIKAARGEV